jgi:hypothetical protein
MVDIPPTVSDDDFEYILGSVSLPPDMDFDAFRSDLTAIGETYRTNKSDLAESPTLSVLKKQLNKTIEATNTQIEAYENLYDRECDDRIYNASPDWIRPITRHLEYARTAAENLLKNYPKIKKGPDPDLAFQFMLRDLVNLYEKYSGRDATSTPQDSESPTEFQRFVGWCNESFLTSDPNKPFGLIDSFDQKVHEALIRHRKTKAAADST